MEVLALWGQESNVSTPKSYPSPLKIGSRTERSRVPGKELSRMSNQMLGSFLFLVASLQFHLFLYLSGETPVILTKNLPKTDWSEKPRLSAISFIPISVLSSKRFASAQSSSDT